MPTINNLIIGIYYYELYTVTNVQSLISPSLFDVTIICEDVLNGFITHKHFPLNAFIIF